MKNLMMLFLVATVSLVSCDKNDDNDSTSGALEGKWQYTKEGNIVDGEEMLSDFVHAPGCTKDYVQLLDNGTFSDHSFDGAACDDTVFSGNWTRSGNIITITETGENPSEIEILSLTSTTLKTKEVFKGEILITIYTKI